MRLATNLALITAGVGAGIALVLACGNGSGTTDASAADGGCNCPAPEPFENRLTWREGTGMGNGTPGEFTASDQDDMTATAACMPSEVALSGRCYLGGNTNGMVYLGESDWQENGDGSQSWRCRWRNFDRDRGTDVGWSLLQGYPISGHAQVLCYRKDQ